jgi:two-component system, LytTR family, response regulator
VSPAPAAGAKLETGIRAIIVDDDASARERLRALLGQFPDVSILQECNGGRPAVAALRSERPDLVFLDIEMPDLDGFGVITEVGAARMPAIIFTSAYSEYAVRAFEAYALDYLLKPFDSGRLAAAIDRARRAITDTRVAVDGPDPRIAGLLAHLEHQLWDKHPQSVAIKVGDQYVVTPLADVDWIEADGNYAKLWVNKRARLMTKTLGTLEREVLDSEVFARVHRSAIVNVSRIASVEPSHHGDMTLVLRDGTKVPCSRRYRERVEQRIYFSS